MCCVPPFRRSWPPFGKLGYPRWTRPRRCGVPVPADHLTTAMELSMNPAAPQRAAAAPDGPPAAVPAGPGYPPAAVPAAADGPSAVVPAVAADPPADDAGFAAWLAGRAGELLL